MIKINDITIDYHSLLAKEDDSYYTDEKRPVIGFSLESDRQQVQMDVMEISVNGWKKQLKKIVPVIYEGEELKPMQTYEISIFAQDQDGDQAKATVVFHTGKMDQSWTGKWITDLSVKNESPVSPKPLEFCTKLILKKPAKKVQIFATAMGIYDLYWGGDRINEDYFAPGFTDYDYHLQYNVYTLRPQKEGSYEFRAIVAAGWATGRSTHIDDTNKSKSLLMADRQAFLADVAIEYEDGTTEITGTDESYEVACSRRYLFADFYDGEVYDASAKEEDLIWKQAGITCLKGKPEIRARYGEKILAKETFTGKIAGKTKAGETVYDFGQNFAGVVDLTIDAKEGDVVTIRHGEALENGELYVKNLRSAKQRIEYHCRDGKQQYSPRFTYMGFRYIAVQGIAPEKIKVHARAVYSDLRETGGFTCSNEDLNQLQHNIVWSGRSNFVDIPTDCPQRDERQGWTGDIALFASTACFQFDMDRFLTKWLMDLKAEQGKNGSIPFVVPVRKGITPSITTSCWGDSCILVPYAMYLSSGNTGVLEEMYPVMKKYLKDIARWAKAGLAVNQSPYVLSLPFQFGDWCAPYGSVPDWLAKGKWTGTAYFAYACACMKEIAVVLGKEKDVRYYEKLHEKVADTYMHKFMQDSGVMPEKESFQTGYVLPLYFGLSQDKKINRTMAEQLWKQILADGGHLKTGFTATPYILFALADQGLKEEAYQLLLEDTNPSWLYQIRKGATTTWEQWDIITENGEIKEGSMNHYAYGAVGDFLYRRVCGLEAVEAGYRRFRVHPVIGGGLTYAECRHDCPYGEIRVRWEKCGEDTYRLKVHVPIGTDCQIELPNRKTDIVENGNYEFTWKE